ncbi:Uncharacterised protein [Edwardsiella tarda]|nr:Uncharacterised protein [Edwardsiella tarda]
MTKHLTGRSLFHQFYLVVLTMLMINIMQLVGLSLRKMESLYLIIELGKLLGFLQQYLICLQRKDLLPLSL